MSRPLLYRTAALQTFLVAALSIALVIALGTHFFVDWGWIVGPAAWLVCSFATALALRLPRARTMLGALLAGVPSAIAVLLGYHTLGDILAIVAFSLWCAWTPAPHAAMVEVA
jgi:hypothetical protein